MYIEMAKPQVDSSGGSGVSSVILTLINFNKRAMLISSVEFAFYRFETIDQTDVRKTMLLKQQNSKVICGNERGR
jgi:hypothetical protein